jgi:hypothetical protein
VEFGVYDRNTEATSSLVGATDIIEWNLPVIAISFISVNLNNLMETAFHNKRVTALVLTHSELWSAGSSNGLILLHSIQVLLLMSESLCLTKYLDDETPRKNILSRKGNFSICFSVVVLIVFQGLRCRLRNISRSHPADSVGRLKRWQFSNI